MTPHHQELIDNTLRLVATRTAYLVAQTDLPRGQQAEKQTLEQL